MDNKSTYVYRVTCSNCGCYQRLDIPKGTTISEYLIGRTCTQCGCLLEGENYRFREPTDTWMGVDNSTPPNLADGDKK